ncbi:MAG: hypothetical protein Q4F84_07300, partial [Fibrobacter sp.]|nr:hypothetical protein [Fibrobacter sp.]
MKRMTLILLLLNCMLAAQQTLQYDVSEENSDPVLILTTKGSIFDQARNGLINEIRDEFNISVIEVSEQTSMMEIDSVVNENKGIRAVVLIGNNAIRVYKKYSGQNKEKTESIQVISLLALDIQRAVSGIRNVTGIAYETPMVTALINFRRVVNKPLDKVGVIYRNSFKNFVTEHTQLSSKEGITIESIEISDDPSKHNDEILKALQDLQKKSIDAFWLFNDNIILKPKLLGEIWIPFFKKEKVPLIAGVESLVD